MARLFNVLGDRLLGIFLHEVRSGACCSQFGQVCQAAKHFTCNCGCA
jgi:hypothetical protein